MRNGYKMVYLPEHHRADKTGCVYEHVLIAEKIIGRPLFDEEVVHHIDENRSNNSPDNLMVFASKGDHTAFHDGSPAYKDGNIWKTERKDQNLICKQCKKVFIPTNYGQQYCSHKCADLARSSISDIDKLVEELLKANGNMSFVAKKYNVSSSYIAKFLRANGRPNHSSDYKISPAVRC